MRRILIERIIRFDWITGRYCRRAFHVVGTRLLSLSDLDFEANAKEGIGY